MKPKFLLTTVNKNISADDRINIVTNIMKIKIQTTTEMEIQFPYYTGTDSHSTCWISENECISIEHTTIESAIANLKYVNVTPFAHRLSETKIGATEFNTRLVCAFDKLYTLVISEQDYEDERRHEIKEREQLLEEEREHEKENMDAIRLNFKK